MADYRLPYCSCLVFHENLEDAPSDCELQQKINHFLPNQIVTDWKNKSKSMPLSLFKKVAEMEIMEAFKKAYEYQDKAAKEGFEGKNMGVYNELYHWNLARGEAITKILEERQSTPRNSQKAETNRQKVWAYWYRVGANLEEAKSATQLKDKYGNGFYKAYFTCDKQNTSYRPVTLQELESVVQLLEPFPNAQNAAINDLEKAKDNI